MSCIDSSLIYALISDQARSRLLAPVRGYFGITEQDSPEAARDKIAGRIVLLDETLVGGLPLLFDFTMEEGMAGMRKATETGYRPPSIKRDCRTAAANPGWRPRAS